MKNNHFIVRTADILCVAILMFLSWFCIPDMYYGLHSPIIPNVIYLLILPTAICIYLVLRIRMKLPLAPPKSAWHCIIPKLYRVGYIVSIALFIADVTILLWFIRDVTTFLVFTTYIYLPLATTSLVIWLLTLWCGYFSKAICGRSDYYTAYILSSFVAFLNSLDLYLGTMGATMPSAFDILVVYMLPVYLAVALSAALTYLRRDRIVVCH